MPQISNDSPLNTSPPQRLEGEQFWAPAAGWNDRLIQQNFGAAEWVESTGSTNADLLSIPHDGRVRPAALRWAGVQLAGRGRRGRRWVGKAGDTLTFSVALERLIDDDQRQRTSAISPAAFSLVAGLMLAQAIEASGLTKYQPTLKWPNDVLLNGSKLAGILVEVSQVRPVQRLVVGCGLNLRSPTAGQFADGPTNALSPIGLLDHDNTAADLIPTAFSPDKAAALITDAALRIREAHEVFFSQGLEPFRHDWLSRHAFHNCPICLSDGEQVLAEGVCTGIAPDGAILIRLPDGERSFALGELSARPGAAVTGGQMNSESVR